MNAKFVFPPPQPARQRYQQTAPVSSSRQSDTLRASVLDAALALGLGSNKVVADWIFNNPVDEDEDEGILSPSLTNRSTATSEESLQYPAQSAGADFGSTNHRTQKGLAQPTVWVKSDPSSHLKSVFSISSIDDSSLALGASRAALSPTPRPSTPKRPLKSRELGDGYESDGGYFSDIGKKGKKSKEEKARLKEEKGRAKDEKDRLRKEGKEIKKAAKKKAKAVEVGYTTGAETDVRDDSFVRTRKKSLKNENSPGEDTDDAGYLSSSSKSKLKSRLFRLTRSKHETVAPPLPSLPVNAVQQQQTLPIADRFASSSSSRSALTPTPLSEPTRALSPVGSVNSSVGSQNSLTRAARRRGVVSRASLESGSSSQGHGVNSAAKPGLPTVNESKSSADVSSTVPANAPPESPSPYLVPGDPLPRLTSGGTTGRPSNPQTRPSIPFPLTGGTLTSTRSDLLNRSAPTSPSPVPYSPIRAVTPLQIVKKSSNPNLLTPATPGRGRRLSRANVPENLNTEAANLNEPLPSARRITMASYDIPPPSPPPPGPLPLPPKTSTGNLIPPTPAFSVQPRSTSPFPPASAPAQRGRAYPFLVRTPSVTPATKQAARRYRERYGPLPSNGDAQTPHPLNAHRSRPSTPFSQTDDHKEDGGRDALRDVLARFGDGTGTEEDVRHEGQAIEMRRSSDGLLSKAKAGKEDSDDEDEDDDPRARLCDSSYSDSGSTCSRSSVHHQQSEDRSAQARSLFVRRVEAMLDENGLRGPALPSNPAAPRLAALAKMKSTGALREKKVRF